MYKHMEIYNANTSHILFLHDNDHLNSKISKPIMNSLPKLYSGIVVTIITIIVIILLSNQIIYTLVINKNNFSVSMLLYYYPHHFFFFL